MTTKNDMIKYNLSVLFRKNLLYLPFSPKETRFIQKTFISAIREKS